MSDSSGEAIVNMTSLSYIRNKYLLNRQVPCVYGWRGLKYGHGIKRNPGELLLWPSVVQCRLGFMGLICLQYLQAETTK